MKGGWALTEVGFSNYREEGNAGSITLRTHLGDYHIFKVEPNGSFALSTVEEEKETIAQSRKLAEQVVKVLNRELPGGKPRSRKGKEGK